MARTTPPDGCVLALDLGTSALRGAVITTGGDVVATAVQPVPAFESEGSLAVDGIWAGLVRLVRGLQPASARIEGIGVSGQLSLVLVDGNGRPTRPGLTWIDRRALTEADEIAGRIGSMGRVTGRRVDPEHWAPKLVWMQRHEPEALERARWVLSLKDFVVLRLTGRAVTDWTHASYTFLFDVGARGWSETLIDACSIDPALLPPVAAAQDLAGELTPAAAAELRLKKGLPVAVGGPDGTLGAVGAGAVRPGVTVDVAGSTDVLLHVVDEPRADVDARAVLNAYALPDLWTIGGPTGMTGGATAWIAQLLGVGTAELYDRWGDAAAALDPGVDRLLFVTTLTGDRFPRWAPQTTGSITGLTLSHTVAHLLRAAEEGAAFVVLEGLEALEHLGYQIGEVVVVGGVAARRALLQLRADAWGIPVRAAANEQASAMGAAMVAVTAAGLAPSLPDAAAAMVRGGPAYVPDSVRTGPLRSAFERWRSTGSDRTPADVVKEIALEAR